MNPGNGPALRDIHLPPEPAWWPPAPGWWLLAGLVLVALFLLGRAWLHHRQRQRERRVLRREFARAAALGGAEQVAALSALLRRAAQRHAPQAMALRDEDWLAFLDADDPAQPFRRGPGRLLLEGPYRARVDTADAAALAAVVQARLDRFVSAPRRGQARPRRASRVSAASEAPAGRPLPPRHA